MSKAGENDNRYYDQSSIGAAVRPVVAARGDSAYSNSNPDLGNYAEKTVFDGQGRGVKTKTPAQIYQENLDAVLDKYPYLGRNSLRARALCLLRMVSPFKINRELIKVNNTVVGNAEAFARCDGETDFAAKHGIQRWRMSSSLWCFWREFMVGENK